MMVSDAAACPSPRSGGSWPRSPATSVSTPSSRSIPPASASYLDGAVQATKDGRCEALLITVNSPGGTLQATRDIVRSLLGSQVPVIVYVTPSGARAGSAAMFVTLAAHVAAHLSRPFYVVRLGAQDRKRYCCFRTRYRQAATEKCGVG